MENKILYTLIKCIAITLGISWISFMAFAVYTYISDIW